MKRLTAPILVALSASLTGCYTTKNVVSVPPLETRYPVSASPQFVDANGTIVTDADYAVSKSFAFEKTMDAPRHESRQAALRLEYDLDRLVSEGQGDAVTNLRIEATEYDTGSHGSSAGLQIMGWSFSLAGGAILATGLAVENDAMRKVFVPMGSATLGIGLLGLALGAFADEPAKWHLRVTGDVVRANLPAPPAAVRPTSASPPAAAPVPAPAAPADPSVPAPAPAPTEAPDPASPHGF